MLLAIPCFRFMHRSNGKYACKPILTIAVVIKGGTWLAALPRLATALPWLATAMQRLATALPRLATALPRLATAMPRLATALPRLATALPRLATGNDSCSGCITMAEDKSCPEKFTVHYYSNKKFIL